MVKVIGFGAVLWDCMAERVEGSGRRSAARHMSLGGSVFNVVAGLEKLGFDAYMLSALGDDKLGEETFKELSRRSIHSDFITPVKAPTCLIEVEFDEAGLPHYSSPSLVSWDWIEVTEKQIDEIDRLDVNFFVFGTLEQRNLISRTTLCKVLDRVHFDTIYLDLTLRGDFYSKGLLDYSMRKATIVKMNEEEALVVNELFDFKQPTLQSLMRTIAHEFDDDIVCITLGCRGALIGDRSTCIYKPGYRITVQDTVGSGDAFSAGLLYMFGKGASFDEACDFANRMGALVSTKKGALPDYNLSDVERMRDLPRTL
jgi:fructokinase